MQTDPKQHPDTQPADESDVDALAPPEPATVTISGQDFTIRPMKVRQVFPFLKLARPLFAALVARPAAPALPPTVDDLAQGGDLPPETDGIEIMAAMNDAKWILETLTEHGEAAVGALAIGCDIPADDLGELEVVGLVVLLKHFVKVNASFFAAQGLSLPQTLPPDLVAAAASVNQPKTK